MELRYNFRLFPDPQASSALARVFGCARVVWNDAVAARQAAYRQNLPFPTTGDLSECPRKGSRIAPPGFRSRKDRRQSARFTNNAGWKITPGGRLSLPKIGELTVRWSRRLPSAPTSVTVVKDAAGRYWASFVVTTDTGADLAAMPESENFAETGIDLGLACFAVLSDGTRISSPRFLRRAEKKLRRMQRQHNRKQKGSKNRERSRIKLAKHHAKVADRRRDFQHKLSTKMHREERARCWLDKATRYGRVFCRVDRWFASTKTCSRCQHAKTEIPLDTRTFECEACGLVMDRDENAAHNVLAEGRRVAAGQRGSAATASGGVRRRKTPVGAPVRPRPKVPAQRDEAGTQPKPHTPRVRQAEVTSA